MKVRKRIILSIITVLMISVMLSGCGKALEPTAKETLNALDGISKEIKGDSPEETTQQDSAESNPEMNTDSETIPWISIL